MCIAEKPGEKRKGRKRKANPQNLKRTDTGGEGIKRGPGHTPARIKKAEKGTTRISPRQLEKTGLDHGKKKRVIPRWFALIKSRSRLAAE